MDKMSKRKALNTIFTVALVGMILTFSAIFITTAVFAPETSISDSYFDGGEHKESIFSAFDAACLRNESFYDAINRWEYKIFNNIPAVDVISGERGFLFSAGVNEYGYDYLEDYAGLNKLSAEQLERFHNYIEMRSRAYENFGCEYVLAVIPNAQSVYGEYMPSYLGKISENTVLSQICDYLDECGCDKLVDLRGAMIDGKVHGQLYNNTENSINAMGAYVVYSGILEHLQSIGNNVMILDRAHFELQTRMTDGKTLAKNAGLSSLIKNKTIFISDSAVQVYSLVELFGDLETTYVKHENIPASSSETLMIECAQEWDKVQLMPYFSSTFSRVSYRVANTYSRSAVVNSMPGIVVQVIREDELASILDDSIMSSYYVGLEPGQNPYVTKEASELACTKIGLGVYCITGTAESGAEITVFGDVVSTVVVNELEGRFFAVVTVSDPSVESQICVSVKAADKAVSGVSYIIIAPDGNDMGTRPVYIDEVSAMLYKNNYNVSPLPDDSTIESFTKSVQKYFSDIRRKNSDVDAKMIVALLPEKISVYKEGLNDALREQSTELHATRMALQRIFSGSGVAFLDGADILRKNMAEYKLFTQMSDELTDIGSYYLYRAIMMRVSRDFSNTAPRLLESYTLARQRIKTGELALALGFKNTTVNEIVYRIVSSESYVTVYNDENGDTSAGFTTYMDDQSLPTAVVLRTSDSDKIIDLMAENFSRMHVLAIGETEIYDDILTKGVDYVIVLADEMDIVIE